MPATFTLPFLLASLIAAQPLTKPTSQLVPGKFGKALDAAVTPLAFGGDERYRTPPLTVECWAKLNSKNAFNVLVSCDPKSSSRHWEIYSYAGSGAFAVYLPGHEPAEIVSKTPICDKQWHHLAFTFDGKIAVLFVDGKKVHEQTVKPRPGARPDSGPLSVGQAIDSASRVGCDGLIDEVHLSRVVRAIAGIPTKPPVVDADTIGLWRFDDSEQILADPAWTPIPNTTGEAWERETDVDWVDARLRKMDTGPTFNGTMSYPIAGGRALVYKGTAIRLGDKGQAGVMFDRNQLRLAAAWTGGFLQHSDRRFGLLNTPQPAGKLLAAHPTSSTTAPMPTDKGRYNGLYLNGQRVILSYTLEGVDVLESPWLEKIAGRDVIKRSFEVGPAGTDLVLPVGDALVTGDGQAQENLSMRKDDRGNWMLRLPASPRIRRFTMYHWQGADKEDPKSVFKDVVWPAPLDLRTLIQPGPARWGAPLETRGEIARDTAPYVVDTLTIPYENRFNALFFTAGHDFLPDGRIAVCTAHGDVWLVQTDAKLEKVSWRRFATGLYHPLGLKVVDGKVVVLERGQLTRLHDDNNDGEADRQENLCHDWHTGAGEHSYDTCLETDSAGNFYFFKTGDTDLPHGGCLMRVGKDGKKVEVFSTGFRHPIGLGVSPGDVVTGADQEGNWMPVTRVDIYKKAGFYGDMRAHHRTTPPKIYDGPLLWLPKNVDNSAGGQVWVPHDKFGFPRGQMLHLSYGRCKLYALLQQKVGDVDQAGAVDLGVKFLSGSARGRFHPENGHLYVTGLRGWQTGAQRDGCLQRVRYTGQPLPMPVGLSVHENGLRLDFAQELDPASIDKSRFPIEQWNYRWSADYGSKYWSVRQPDRQGRDSLVVEQATLSPDRKKVFLSVKGLGPVMQMRIGYQVKTSSGQDLTGSIYNTIHRLAETRSISRGN